MLDKTTVYFFSPTGGTKKVAAELAKKIAKTSAMIDLGAAGNDVQFTDDVLIVVAAPVFGGRIPSLVTDCLEKLNGNGKKAVTLAVYGNRAYEDALLELNDTLKKQGFLVVASGAFIAQHSMAPDVAEGRPNEADLCVIDQFAVDILKKIENPECSTVEVPGNFPYKDMMKVPATPISTEACDQCEKCVTACPVHAITIHDTIATDPRKCILCMGCTTACPNNARILPPPLAEKMAQMLAPLKNIRKENEIFI